MRVLGFSGLLLALACSFAHPAAAGAPAVAWVWLIQTGPMEVTTDTAEYCQHLLHRIRSLARVATVPVPHDVADLTSEGKQMCDNGQTRGGIMRLRSALMLMEKSSGASYR
jgi:hypothetical protein